MRKLLLAAALIVGGFAANAQDVKVDQVVKVSTEKYDFGKIKQGVPVNTAFEIKNISDKPVVIESATGSCGCTTPTVPKEPIAPGATAKLPVNYNAAAMGAFTKTVTVKFAGVNEPKVLTITGETMDATAWDASHSAKPAAPAAAENKTKVKTSSTKEKAKTKSSK
ncbi:DUF1573 domain-containing protein [Flaviaesturariibacter aridisoli]|uniref:DUF1573 domain-containing protein n=1 Tax=Flaviaesturariibacter aridisoli TaxID=2545761 RepID=A0A4R4E5K4_9BACT|nr:DUF1573 domain-containing protein [Flaviaesturariibacter aridisoli]TCZ72928.1 DUF1573 domain-containing protein [Flaviaesturariibacter aridisoli]